MPEAYLFDMDGLLLDSERVAMSSFLATVVPKGIARATAEPFFLTLVGTSAATTNAMLREFLPAALKPDEIIEEWRANFDEAIDKYLPVKEGVAEVLADLAGQGARMAVVTSTMGARARHHLEVAGLLDLVEFVLGGDEVRATKPDPAPYLQAAERLGVDPRRCAAFEDSDRGIAAAVAAGCHAVQIPDLRPVDKPLPELGQMVASSLAQAVQMARQSVAAASHSSSGAGKPPIGCFDSVSSPKS